MNLSQLQTRCESEIEKTLLRALYPHLSPLRTEELSVQYLIDFYPDMEVTLPDFAFSEAKIAIYCDGYEWHKDPQQFFEDRYQSRDLQLRDWLVLRFTGSEIESDIDTVVQTIRRAINRQSLLQSERQKSRHLLRAKKEQSKGGGCGLIVGTLIVGIVVIILIEIFIW